MHEDIYDKVRPILCFSALKVLAIVSHTQMCSICVYDSAMRLTPRPSGVGKT